MYPQYGGSFCRVIDNYDPRAEDLIDDLKGEGNHPELTIGISVDMLDTGIDIPEIVNLVFAKPVYSYIKFWQMIGRGTRLCPNLFGPGLDKKKFLIFDHWGNFEYFDEHYTEAEPNGSGKSIQQVLFEERIRLAEAAIAAQDHQTFALACDLLLQDVRDLPDTAIAVRDKWREVKTVQQDGVIQRFDAATKSMLQTTIAPLMQWRNITGHLPAYECDVNCCRLQTAVVKQSARLADLRDELVGCVAQLPINLNPVREKIAVIQRVKSGSFWEAPTVPAIEEVRRELRGIMKYRTRPTGPAPLPPKVLDVVEEEADVYRTQYRPRFAGLELIEYRSRFQALLTGLIDATPPLQKIRAGQPVTAEELDKITALVLAQEPDLDLTDLLEYYPETAGNLAVAIRSIIGLDAETVNARFTAFAHQYTLNSTQLRFLDLLKNHIRDFGAIELDQLYETPFTALDKDGLDGVFPDEHQAEELVAIVESFSAGSPTKIAT